MHLRKAAEEPLRSLPALKLNVLDIPNGAYIAQCHRQFDMNTSPAVRMEIISLLNKNRISHLAVDLSAVSCIDSSGIATLVEGLNLSRKRKAKFTLVGVSPEVEAVLDLVGLKSLFDMVPGMGPSRLGNEVQAEVNPVGRNGEGFPEADGYKGNLAKPWWIDLGILHRLAHFVRRPLWHLNTE